MLIVIATCAMPVRVGAALAGTCAIDLVENGYRNVYVYDYGEPRIGNQAMANYLQQMIPSYYRVVNGKDIVPNLPYEVLVREMDVHICVCVRERVRY